MFVCPWTDAPPGGDAGKSDTLGSTGSARKRGGGAKKAMQANKSALRAPRALCCLTLSNPIRMAALALVEWKYPSLVWCRCVCVCVFSCECVEPLLCCCACWSLNCRPQALWHFHSTCHFCQLCGHGRDQAVPWWWLQRHQPPAGELLKERHTQELDTCVARDQDLSK